MPRLRIVEATAQPPPDLFIEANHRITNHLSMLLAIFRKEVRAMELRPPLIPRDDVVDTLNSMVGKFLAVLSLHRSFAASPKQEESDLSQAAINILCELQDSGIFGDRLHFVSAAGEPCPVKPNQASMLALILSEIVTNAIKYAHPTGLPVELSIATSMTQDGEVLLEIGDDGVGLPEGFVEARDAGVGLKLVRSMVERSGGHLELHSDSLGLRFIIHLPV